MTTIKLVTLPEDWNAALPSWSAIREHLPTVTWADLTPGRGTALFLFSVALVACVAGLVGGICDWHQHCCYAGRETMLRWPFGPVLVFSSLVAGILVLIFFIRFSVHGGV